MLHHAAEPLLACLRFLCKEGFDMQQPDERDESLWGARVNTKWRHASGDSPGWAKPHQREKSDQRGPAIWYHEDKETTWLSPTTNLRLLNQLWITDHWQERGLIIGKLATRIWLN